MLNGIFNINGMVVSNQSNKVETKNPDKDFLSILNTRVKTEAKNYENFAPMAKDQKLAARKSGTNPNGQIRENSHSKSEISKSPSSQKQDKEIAKDKNKNNLKDKEIESDKEEDIMVTFEKIIDLDMEDIREELLPGEDEEDLLLIINDIIPAELLQELQEILTILMKNDFIAMEEIDDIVAGLVEIEDIADVLPIISELLSHKDIYPGDTIIDFDSALAFNRLEELAEEIMPADIEGLIKEQLNGEENTEKTAITIDPETKNTTLTEADQKSMKASDQDKIQNKLAINEDHLNEENKVKVSQKLEEVEIYPVEDFGKGINAKIRAIINQPYEIERLEDNNFLEQLIHKVNTIHRTGRNQLRLQLIPENLGKLSINLSSNNQDIKAKIYVESTQVKQTIENNLNQFRDSLREKGVNITDIEVSVGQDPEAFRHSRGHFQPRSKFKRLGPDISYNKIENTNLEIINKTNPYLVETGFNKLG